MKKYFTLLLLTFSFLGYGQIESDSVSILLGSDSIRFKKRELIQGSLSTYQDPYYEAVERIQKRINKESCPNLVKGFRVQVFSCSGGNCKEKADKYYSQFLMAYPELPVYKMWQPPSLKVRAGNCRSRFEAEGIKKLIEGDFPFVFIVPDFIETHLMLGCDKMTIPDKVEIK